MRKIFRAIGRGITYPFRVVGRGVSAFFGLFRKKNKISVEINETVESETPEVPVQFDMSTAEGRKAARDHYINASKNALNAAMEGDYSVMGLRFYDDVPYLVIRDDESSNQVLFNCQNHDIGEFTQVVPTEIKDLSKEESAKLEYVRMCDEIKTELSSSTVHQAKRLRNAVSDAGEMISLVSATNRNHLIGKLRDAIVTIYDRLPNSEPKGMKALSSRLEKIVVQIKESAPLVVAAN